jgi:hypothetical protein
MDLDDSIALSSEPILTGWDGRPADPMVGSWYWLFRTVGEDVRHAAWYWCDECRQWEAEPGMSFSAEAVAEQGWRLLAATNPPSAT